MRKRSYWMKIFRIQMSQQSVHSVIMSFTLVVITD